MTWSHATAIAALIVFAALAGFCGAHCGVDHAGTCAECAARQAAEADLYEDLQLCLDGLARSVPQ